MNIANLMQAKMEEQFWNPQNAQRPLAREEVLDALCNLLHLFPAEAMGGLHSGADIAFFRQRVISTKFAAMHEWMMKDKTIDGEAQ